MEITPTKILLGVALLAAIAFVGRLLKLFRQSDAIEKTLDYSQMREWDDEDD